MKIGNLEVYGIIYKITNKINGKVYIGQTIKGFNKRYSGGDWYKSTHNKHLQNSADKYGIDNFEVVYVFDIAFSKIELDLKEDMYIKYYNSICPNFGYNKKEGGAKGKPSQETREKLSILNRGEKNPMYGRVGKLNSMYGKNPLSYMSKGDYDRLMATKRGNTLGEKNPMYGAYGEKNPFYGKHHSEETKKILSEKAKRRLSEYNPLKGKKHPECQYGNNPRSKNDIKMTFLETGEILLFDSIKRCVEWLLEYNIVEKI